MMGNGTRAVRRQPDGAIALVARPLRTTAAVAAIGLAVVAAHEQLHHMVPDSAVRVSRACAGYEA